MLSKGLFVFGQDARSHLEERLVDAHPTTGLFVLDEHPPLLLERLELAPAHGRLALGGELLGRAAPQIQALANLDITGALAGILKERDTLFGLDRESLLACDHLLGLDGLRQRIVENAHKTCLTQRPVDARAGYDDARLLPFDFVAVWPADFSDAGRQGVRVLAKRNLVAASKPCEAECVHLLSPGPRLDHKGRRSRFSRRVAPGICALDDLGGHGHVSFDGRGRQNGWLGRACQLPFTGASTGQAEDGGGDAGCLLKTTTSQHLALQPLGRLNNVKRNRYAVHHVTLAAYQIASSILYDKTNLNTMGLTMLTRKRIVLRIVIALLGLVLGLLVFAQLKPGEADEPSVPFEPAHNAEITLPAELEITSKSCKGGVMAACYELGVQLASGVVVESNIEAARELFETACHGGHTPACVDLGLMFEEGLGVSIDVEGARRWYQMACDGGDPTGCSSLEFVGQGRDALENALERNAQHCEAGDLLACVDLGIFYGTGQGVVLDIARAYALYARACEGGQMLGCYYLGAAFASGEGVERDLNRAKTLYEKSCDGGELSGCNNLAAMLEAGPGESGEGGPVRDLAGARALYERSCEGENMRACHNLAVLYQSGSGVKADPRRARELFEKACEGWEGAACHSLAVLHARGDDSSSEDVDAARLLYEKACQAGFAPSCHNAGIIYAMGQGVEADFVRARALLNQACEGQHMLGCYFLGALHERGQGGPASKTLADALYARACQGGVALACAQD